MPALASAYPIRRGDGQNVTVAWLPLTSIFGEGPPFCVTPTSFPEAEIFAEAPVMLLC
jgi:hypothetical protein